MDWAQQQFKCCEKVNSTENCPKDGEVKSCYKGENCNGTLYKGDCKQRFIDFVENNLVVIGAVALAIAFVQVRGTVCFKILRSRKVYLESFTSSLISAIL